jgi:nitrile hydratase
MDGVHDLGGKQGFGPVRYASSRTPFKAAWEPRANALYSLGVRLGLINMDEYRHSIERMEPRHYLSASYYERSLTGFATLCVEKGIVSQEELERLAEGVISALPAKRRGPAQCDAARVVCRR